MLDFFSNQENALTLLKSDHDKVKDLFEQFENVEDKRQKKKIAGEAIMELKIHATIEEEIFYPAVRRQLKDKDIMNEADEEHHVAKLLIAELDQMKMSDEHYEAKFTVLAENIRHHIKEEEGQMFPQLRMLDLNLEALGEQLQTRKDQLKKGTIPVSAEEKMISRFGMKDDSPAQNAQKSTGEKPGRKGSYSSGSRTAPKRSGKAARRKRAG